jgi:hypothetical protein
MCSVNSEKFFPGLISFRAHKVIGSNFSQFLNECRMKWNADGGTDTERELAIFSNECEGNVAVGFCVTNIVTQLRLCLPFNSD